MRVPKQSDIGVTTRGSNPIEAANTTTHTTGQKPAAQECTGAMAKDKVGVPLHEVLMGVVVAVAIPIMLAYHYGLIR